MAKIHISGVSFQESLEAAIERALDTRKIHGGQFPQRTQEKRVNLRSGVGVPLPPITLGIIYRPNENL